jgi:hypothetical protein
VKLELPIIAEKFPLVLEAKLSRQATLAQSSIRYSQRLEPINPAPPVTNIFLELNFKKLFLMHKSFFESGSKDKVSNLRLKFRILKEVQKNKLRLKSNCMAWDSRL